MYVCIYIYIYVCACVCVCVCVCVCGVFSGPRTGAGARRRARRWTGSVRPARGGRASKGFLSFVVASFYIL